MKSAAVKTAKIDKNARVEGVFQKQSDKRLRHGLDLRARHVKYCEVVAVLPAVCWLRFDAADEFRVIELQGAPAAGCAFASEAERGVGRDSIELDVCISVVFQSGQRRPDLKQDFLIKIVAIRWFQE